MRHARTVEALVGSTPLVDLSDLTSSPATILGKLEAANPGGSAKDR
ncbi:TPA: cysteine synthase A, partial [Clostridioides difficile]|nr:cysteine synthase A [Clostridioides difficile]